jgi:hypothetical protein
LSEVDYLGHVVSGQGIALSQARKQGVAGLKAPTSVAKLRSFLGLANYFRPFVDNFAVMAKPLARLCSPKVRFEWGVQQDRAFRALKQAIVDAPVLAYLNYSREVILRTDASIEGVGAVLLQRDGGGAERPVCYVSRAFTPTQSRWSTLEQEAFAVYFAVTTLSHYLQGTPFVVETDHRNLLSLGRWWPRRLSAGGCDWQSLTSRSATSPAAATRLRTRSPAALCSAIQELAEQRRWSEPTMR